MVIIVVLIESTQLVKNIGVINFIRVLGVQQASLRRKSQWFRQVSRANQINVELPILLLLAQHLAHQLTQRIKIIRQQRQLTSPPRKLQRDTRNFPGIVFSKFLKLPPQSEIKPKIYMIKRNIALQDFCALKSLL